MIVRNNSAVSFLIEFPSGFPDGNIVWTVYDPNGVVLHASTIAVPANAVSVNLIVDADLNSLASGLNSYRDVEWSYTTNGSLVTGEVRYDIEKRVPFGASPSGVRTKLGIDSFIDLPDNEISLVRAYHDLTASFDPNVLSAADPSSIIIRDAIESQAALTLLPTLMVRLAAMEDSGTSKFQRQKIDYDSLSQTLTNKVLAGYYAINPYYDPSAAFGAIFVLASPGTDAFTGATT